MKRKRAKRNPKRAGEGRETVVNRKHKDRLFRMIFSDKAALLELYNAMRGSGYRDPEELVITTSEDVIYMGMKNDISFLVDAVLNLYEHQASFNPNMGLRGFLYLADAYRKFIKSQDLYLYGSKAVVLPVPQYVVFYNGTEKEADRMELRLSDLFEKVDGVESCIEVTAVMLNINKGHNGELMEKSRKLWEYAEFIERIRENQRGSMELEEAVNRAVEACIRDNVLSGFLRAHRAEVIEVVLTEYDEKGYIAYEKRLSREEGRQEGIEEGRREGIEEGRQEGIQEGRREGMELGGLRKLIGQVCRKLARGKCAEQIAEELEEAPETVALLCEIAGRYAPEYDCEKILRQVQGIDR